MDSPSLLSSNRKQLASFDPAGGTTWTLLSDAPAELGGVLGMGEFQDRLWVATGSRLYFYHPMTSMWDLHVDTPPGLKAAAVAGGHTYVLCKTPGGTEVYQLIYERPIYPKNLYQDRAFFKHAEFRTQVIEAQIQRLVDLGIYKRLSRGEG